MKNYFLLPILAFTFLSINVFGQYCTPTATSTFGRITEVSSSGGDLNFSKISAGAAGYSNYSASESISTVPGSSFNLSVTTVSATSDGGVSVWIDWDGNNTFATGERVYVQGANSAGTKYITINVPSNASVGSKRMRVMVGDNLSNPCGGGTTSEAEDFTVSVTAPKTRDVQLVGLGSADTCYGSQEISIHIANRGTDSLETITLTGTIGTTTFGPTTFTGLGLKRNEDTILRLGSFSYVGGSAYSLNFYSSGFNGTTDQKTLNDTLNMAIDKVAMCGTYTIGGTSKGGDLADFENFTAARNALYANKIDGPVIFNVSSGTYNERLLFTTTIQGLSSINTIRFRADPANSAPATLTSNSNTLTLQRVSYMAFDSLNIESTGNGYVVQVLTLCDYISFRGNTLKGFTGNSNSFGQAVVYVRGGGSNGTSNFSFIGNTTNYGSLGLLIIGTSNTAATQIDGCVIKNNTFRDFYYQGLNLRFLKNGIVEGNEIQSRIGNAVTGIYGLWNTNVDIISNKVTVNATGYARPIWQELCWGSTTKKALVANNMFSNLCTTNNSNTYNFLFRLDYTDFINNSFYSQSVTTRAFVWFRDGTSIKIKNNSSYVNGPGYAMQVNGTFDRSNNNLYGFNGTRNIFGATQGSNGTNVNPGYFSPSDLHTSSKLLYQKGISFAGVSKDIDGENRHVTTPNIGADEYVLTTIDALPTSIVSASSCAAPDTFKVKVKNGGLNTLTSFKVDWSYGVNGGAAVNQTQVSWSGSLTSGEDTLLVLGIVNTTAGAEYSIQARTTLPNNGTDGTISNDTLIQLIKSALNGSYTVGGSSPDFNTPNDALSALASSGICGAVVFNIRKGNYEGQLKMEEIQGSSAANTITWRGESATNTVLSFTPVVGNLTMIDLNGTDNMTFSNLRLYCNASSLQYAKNVRLYNNADHITIDSCVIEQNGNRQYQSTGIAASLNPINLSSGHLCHDLKVTNCTIKGMDFGVGAYGFNTANLSKKLTIENNLFTNVSSISIDVYYTDSIELNNNTIKGDINLPIQFRYNKNYKMSNNNIVSNLNSSISLFQCNYHNLVSTDYGLITNNFFSSLSAWHAVKFDHCSNVTFYHNSCRSISGYAIDEFRGINKRFHNNIFYSETNYAWNSSDTSASYLTSVDNNLFYSGKSNDTVKLHGVAKTLASWKTDKPSFNANSIFGDPKFISSSDLRIANSASVDSLGASGLGISKDFFGTTRSTTHPDAGAYEFDYQANDGYLVAINQPTNNCLSSADTLEFSVVNLGGDTLDMSVNNMNIAWSVTGPITSSGTIVQSSGKLAPRDTIKLQPSGSTINLNTAGNYSIAAYITSSWDNNADNDSTMSEVKKVNTGVLSVTGDTTIYYKDSTEVEATLDIKEVDVVFSEVCQWGTGVGSPFLGRPSFMSNEDEYVEISSASAGLGMYGYTFERWVGSSLERTYTFEQGAKTNSNGTLILGLGSNNATSTNDYYYSTGGLSNVVLSNERVGYILKDSTGKILDAVATNGFGFPGVSGVNSTHWSGTISTANSHGVRRNGPDVNSAANWINSQSLSDKRQDPNELNAGMDLKISGPDFRWTYNGTTVDSVLVAQAGPFTTAGNKNYIASFVTPCGDTIKDTATIITYANNLVLTGNRPAYYNYPLSQTNGIGFNGSVMNEGDSMSNVKVYAQIDGAAAGDSLVAAGIASNDTSNFIFSNSANVSTTGNKTINYYLTANVADFFPNDDSASTVINVSDSIMSRENGILPISMDYTVNSKIGQRFSVFSTDSVTGAQAYVKTAFSGEKFKIVLYALNGNVVGAKVNESGEMTLQSASDTGLKTIRFNCLSVLSAGDYLVSVEKSSTVFNSAIGANKISATADAAFGYNGSSWSTIDHNGEALNLGIRLIFGSYELPTFASVNPACISGDKFLLSGGSPTGGSYYGTGVSSDSLNPTLLSLGSNNVYYTVDNTYGCPDTVVSTIDIKADPIVSSNFTQLTSCVLSNAAISISASGSFGNLSYSINNGSTYQASNTFSNIGTGSYTLVVKDSTCVVTDTTYVAVLPAVPNTPNATGGGTYCKGVTLNKVKVSTNTSGTAGTFNWYKDASLTNAHGTGDSIAPADTAMVQVYYVVEVRAGCVSLADSTTVTIHALPIVTNAAIAASCSNSNNITLSSGTPSGGTYTGTGVGSGVFNPITAGAGSHIITYSFTDGNNCSNSDTSSIIVRQAPVSNFSITDSSCSNSAKFNLSGGTPSGGTYSGVGVSANQFDPTTVGAGLHTIKYKVSNVNCSDSSTAQIRVHSISSVSLSLPVNWCLNKPALKLNSGMPSGGTYFVNGVADTTYSSALAGNDTIVYSFSDSNNCVNYDTAYIRADTVPAVTFTAIPNACVGTSMINLIQGNPAGGIYSGNNVSGGQYNPDTVATDTLRYFFKDKNGCSESANQTIDVKPLPTVLLSSFNGVCINAGLYNLVNGTPSGGTYSGNGITGTSFDPVSRGIGIDTVTYTYSDANNCTNYAKESLEVFDAPKAIFRSLDNICDNSESELLTAGLPSGGSYIGKGISGNMFTPSDSLLGINTLSYVVSNSNCSDTAMTSFTVLPSPIFNITGDTEGCGREPVILSTNAPVGSVHHWNSGNKGNTASITSTSTVWVKVTDPSTQQRCSSYDTVSVSFEAECLGLDEGLTRSDILYFPNPNTGSFNYSITGFEGVSAELKVLSASGQVVYNQTLETMSSSESGTISINDVEQGVYFIYLTSEKGSAVHRIVVNE